MYNTISGKFISSFHTGGEVKYINVDNLSALDDLPQEFIVLGKGTKVLISDCVSHLIAINNLKGYNIDDHGVYIYSGETLSSVIYNLAKNSINFLPKLIGIPASVGGAIKMNAGCFGSKISDCIKFIDVYRMGKIVRLNADECEFGYRTSNFLNNDFIIGAYFSTFNDDACMNIIRDVSLKRAQSQPIGYSAGSVFRNPKGHYAAHLIESIGLKGYSYNGAMVSDKHANFIINYDNASSHDIYCLINIVKQQVKKNTGINLVEEIIYIGDF